MRANESNFFGRPSPTPQFRMGEPPPYVNGLDDQDPNWLPELLAYEDSKPHPDDAREPIEDVKVGSSVWVMLEAWKSADIPRRPWLARGYLLRGALTVISGAGAAGKSSLMVAWAATASLGCSFRHFKPMGELRVATYNVEDDQAEQQRRFSAMLGQMRLTPEALQGRLAILGPKDIGTLLTITRDGVALNTAVMDELEAFVAEFKPDVLILDPFVELHSAEENDNTAVRTVLARLRAMAVRHYMAVVILHHTRKGAGDPGDPDTLRGASAIVGAARVVLTITVMSKDEAETFGIMEKDRRSYFRLDGAKSNYAAIQDAEWFERREVVLDNDGDGEPADRVAVAWPWEPPTLWQELSIPQINEALDRIADGPSQGTLYAPSKRGRDNSRWAGKVLVELFGVNDKQAASMISTWLKNEVLVEEEFRDPSTRHPRNGVRVNEAKRPG